MGCCKRTGDNSPCNPDETARHVQDAVWADGTNEGTMGAVSVPVPTASRPWRSDCSDEGAVG